MGCLGAMCLEQPTDKLPVVRFVLPYKGEKPSRLVKQRMSELGNRVLVTIQPVFTSRKISENFGAKEEKPELVNQQCVVYHFKCGRCDADYVGMTTLHKHERIDGHTKEESSIAKHMLEAHGTKATHDDIASCFTVLRKCRNKFDCLVYEMFLIRKFKPSLNKQGDSLKAKLFKEEKEDE